MESKADKTVPLKTHQKMRGHFSSNKYCTYKQICSLLSRWASKVKSTALEALSKAVADTGTHTFF